MEVLDDVILALRKLHQPVIAAVNPGSEVARLVNESGAGWIADSSRPQQLPETIAEALDDPDVIVAEGFSGNIALKAAEGTARQMADFLRNAMASSWQSKIGYLFARSAFKALREKLDPNKSNGGMLLGLKGLVVKSHGGINAEGFAYAVDVGYEMVRCDLLTKISALVQAQIAQEVVS